jgi:hypothetical protein
MIAPTRQPGMGQNSFIRRAMGAAPANAKHRCKPVTIHAKCGRTVNVVENGM